MNRIIWSKGLAISVCILTMGCNTISNIQITDNVRKVVTYESNKKIKVVSEKIEMEDPLNHGQWWQAKKTSNGIYAFTAKGIASKKLSEDDQMSLDYGDSGNDGY